MKASEKPVEASDRFTEATRFDGETKTLRVVEGHFSYVRVVAAETRRPAIHPCRSIALRRNGKSGESDRGFISRFRVVSVPAAYRTS